jgi:hypothetical protein
MSKQVQNRMSKSTQQDGLEFFEARTGGSTGSARVIVPIVFDLIRPKSVIDVDCGIVHCLLISANEESNICSEWMAVSWRQINCLFCRTYSSHSILQSQ